MTITISANILWFIGGIAIGTIITIIARFISSEIWLSNFIHQVSTNEEDIVCKGAAVLIPKNNPENVFWAWKDKIFVFGISKGTSNKDTLQQ